MSAPTLLVRTHTYGRDGNRCVSCHALEGLSFQHRRAVGMGGSKMRPGVTDGLTLCMPCNEACEADLQDHALANGWKVRRWADPVRVPVYYPHEFQWYRLEGTARYAINGASALDLMYGVYGDEYTKWRFPQ